MQFVSEPEKWHAFPSCIFTIVAESIGCGAPTGGEHRGRGAGVGVRHAGSGALSMGTGVLEGAASGRKTPALAAHEAMDELLAALARASSSGPCR